MTSQLLTFNQKGDAIEYAVQKLLDGLPLSVTEQASIEAAGVNLSQVEDYVSAIIESGKVPESE